MILQVKTGRYLTVPAGASLFFCYADRTFSVNAIDPFLTPLSAVVIRGAFRAGAGCLFDRHVLLAITGRHLPEYIQPLFKRIHTYPYPYPVIS
jgi:hypothetical protein